MNTDAIIWLISFIAIYLIFLLYDLFGRQEKLGYLGYYAALLPANYLWALVVDPAYPELQSFGVLGAMSILVLLWILLVVRDLFLSKSERKDADDIAVNVIIGLIIQLIFCIILPTLPNIGENFKTGSFAVFNFLWLPQFNGDGVMSSGVIIAYKTLTTILVALLVLPTVSSQKGKKRSGKAILILTAIFAVPFAWVAFIWLPGVSMIPLLFLICVLFAALMFKITSG